MTLQFQMRRLGRGWTSAGPELRGIVLMCASTMGFATMHVLIRYASAELHPMQIAFFRNFFGFLIFLPIIARSGIGFLATSRPALHLVRGVVNIAAMLLFFYALSITEVARVTALAFSAPIDAAVLSVLFLGERFRWHRWSAIVMGFVGVLIVLRPGVIPLELGPMLVIVSSFLWAVCMIIIKMLSRTEPSIRIVAYMNILLTLFSIGPALWVWQWPSAEGWALMVVIGVAGTLAQLALSQALTETEATVVMPFDFLRLIWVAALGYLIFGNIPGAYVWLGGAVIFTSGFYLAWRERRGVSAADAAGSGPAPARTPRLGDRPEQRRPDEAG